jgi:hypothetical protein
VRALGRKLRRLAVSVIADSPGASIAATRLL